MVHSTGVGDESGIIVNHPPTENGFWAERPVSSLDVVTVVGLSRRGSRGSLLLLKYSHIRSRSLCAEDVRVHPF